MRAGRASAADEGEVGREAPRREHDEENADAEPFGSQPEGGEAFEVGGAELVANSLSLVATWKSRAGDFLRCLGRSRGPCLSTAARPRGFAPVRFRRAAVSSSISRAISTILAFCSSDARCTAISNGANAPKAGETPAVPGKKDSCFPLGVPHAASPHPKMDERDAEGWAVLQTTANEGAA
jgi:hypothetical protein